MSLTKEQEDELQEVLWGKDGVDIPSGGYNSAVDLDVMSVLLLLSEKQVFNDDLAVATGMSQEHVELIQYILCSRDLADYGTSPRGCWLTDKGKVLAEKIRPLLNHYAEEP